MKRYYYILFFLVFLIQEFKAQNISFIPRYIEDIFDQRGEVYFSFTVNNTQDIGDISPYISIDNVNGTEVIAYANRNEFEIFLTYNFPYTILQAPGTLINPVMRDIVNIKSINNWDYYPTYGAYESMLLQFQSLYPSLCKVYNLGTLQSGRSIFAVKISDNVNTKENEPRFNYSSSMHGDELTGYVMMLRLIDYLLSNYGTNPRVTYLVNNIEIWITPLENPDGAYTNDNSTVSGATRNNANNVDLNRNYRNPKSGDHPDGNAWQQETLITMAYADSMKFTLSANLHGGIECVNFPWDSWTSTQKTHADHQWWLYVSHQYADTARFYSPSTYFNPSGSSFVNGVTHGGDWYVATGTRQDYLTAFTNSREFTLEISNTKTPSASTLPNYWDYNYRSFLNYLEQSLFGLRGIVTDSCTGNPIQAEVFINGHDIDNSHVYSHLPIGNYHRPMLTGTYSVTFSATGYTSKTFTNVLVSNNNTTVLNAALSPLAPQATLSASPYYSCNGEVSFNAQIQNAATWQWHFGNGSSSNTANPIYNYIQNGVYYPSLTLTNCAGSQTIYLADSIIIEKPLPPTIQGGNNCGAGTVTLTASSQGSVYWYDSLSAQNPLDTGNTYITPIISQTTTYYAETRTDLVDQVGESNATTGGLFYNSNARHYLVFDCYKPVKLLSVLVNANTDGNRTIYLRNNASIIIDSAVVFIPSGISRIDLNFDIPVGNDLQLCGPVFPNLYRNQSTSFGYPYTVPGYISIKHSSATSNPTGYYYFFYDWEMKLDDCISQRVQVIASILSTPDAAFTELVNDLIVSFNNTSNSADSYYWNFGDGNTSTLSNPTHTYADYGSYTVMLIATNTCGNDTTYRLLNLSTLAPQADFTANQISVPQGGMVQFTDLTLNNPNNWLWEFEGGSPPTSTQKNPLVQYNTTGTYNVKLTVSNAFGNDSIIKDDYIEVYQSALAPSANFTSDMTLVNAGDSVQFTDLSLYMPTSWLWNFEGGTPSSSNLQHPTVIYNTPGLYFVSLIATNAYGTDYEMKYDYIQVEPQGISSNDAVFNLSIYPNPAINEIYFSVKESGSYTFIIYDLLGNRIIEYPVFSTNQKVIQLDISGLAGGIYYLQGISINRIIGGKFFKL